MSCSISSWIASCGIAYSLIWVTGEKVSKLQDLHDKVWNLLTMWLCCRIMVYDFCVDQALWCRDVDTNSIRSWGSFFGWAPTTPKPPLLYCG